VSKPPSVQIGRDKSVNEVMPLGYTRRGLLTLTGVAALGTVAGDLFGAFGSNSAQAAEILWNHPFTVRGTKGSNVFVVGGHKGQDYSLPGEGARIYSVAAGTVVDSTTDHSVYGNYVKIDHGVQGSHRYYSYYGHMKGAPRVNVGDSVPAATHIGAVGNSKGPDLAGTTVGFHLHISIIRDTTLVDPVPYVDDAPLAGSPGVPLNQNGGDVPDMNSYVDTASRDLEIDQWTNIIVSGTGTVSFLSGNAIADAQLGVRLTGLAAGAVLQARVQVVDVTSSTTWNVYRDLSPSDIIGTGGTTYGQHSEKVLISGADRRARFQIKATTTGVRLVSSEVRWLEW
jgi:hypothetical protein